MADDGSSVAVIGAGIVGGSIAWRLAQAGAVVTLLDAGVLGGETSWAGAGMLAPGGELIARSGWAAFALESMARYPAFVEELAAESGIGIDYRRCGAMEFAHSEADWQELRERRESQQALGIRSEQRAGALYYPDDALVDPRQVMQALRGALRQQGVSIVENTKVHAIQPGTRRVNVVTPGGGVIADWAVLAAGAWSSEIPISGFAIPRTFPVRGHLLGYSMAPGSLGPILRHGHTYVMQRTSGFTIAGTSSEQAGFDRTIDPKIVAGIHAAACELLPALSTAQRTDAWLGFRPATEDFEPVIGRLQDTRLWLAYGHYRNGILLAPATAARVAREIRSSLEKG
ncbi:MAG TPA: glycine oxidase ThiO [Bryobacteraceae bacterium]|nr:glycine oxidase ThiO [Bryobacteraceae bacterium]